MSHDQQWADGRQMICRLVVKLTPGQFPGIQLAASGAATLFPEVMGPEAAICQTVCAVTRPTDLWSDEPPARR